MNPRSILVASAACLLISCSSMPGSRSAGKAAAVDSRLLELERETTRARLEIERLQRRVAELEAARMQPPAAEAQTDPARRAPAFEADPPAPPPLRAPIEESDLGEETREGVQGDPETARYEAALRLLRDGRAEQAESALARFAADRPDSDLADNAWFWIGESRLVRGDLAGALTAYRITLERYPEGNKVPDALLKLGTTLALDGDLESAREAWRELIRRFPDTVAADTARDRLGPE